MKRKAMIPIGLGLILAITVGVYVFASGAGQRPMSGQIELWGGPNGSTCNSTSNRIELAGTGTLAHLGAVEVSASNCTGADVETAAADISAGSAMFTAADGSTLTVAYHGNQDAPDGNISAYTTTHTITGGTGRFVNANGVWTIAGTVDLSIGKLLGDVSGWISY
jgi:hypothetical protein